MRKIIRKIIRKIKKIRKMKKIKLRMISVKISMRRWLMLLVR
jgi:hypothetical protein